MTPAFKEPMGERPVSRTVAVNLRREAFDIYIGRPSVFGNPFTIGRDGTREQVIACYREWLNTRLNVEPGFWKLLQPLRGKRLGCFCKPKACHGDVLAELLDSGASPVG